MPHDARTLTDEERAFFSLIKEATLTNPFSVRRDELDRKISGTAAASCPARHLEKAVDAVKGRIQSLDKTGRGNINLFSGQDRHLVENLFAFDFFYIYRKQFDQLILDQIDAGDRVIKLGFANEAKATLQNRGFDEESIKSIIEESYQLRRAFFFINRNLVGKSEVMQKLRLDLWNNIFTHNFELYKTYLRDRMEDFSTIILGGTGSGKGAVAAAIGNSGYIPFDMRRNRFVESFTRFFISINLSQFPESIIESELFGHKKGAFTGANEDYNGIFSRCGLHGSILLDEIGEISLPMQIKLLQVLQERYYYPVGSRKKERFCGRVIAATNGSIDKLRHEGIFRDDFYYRLCSDVIYVPSLRERLEQDAYELDNLIAVIVKRTVGRDAPEFVKMVQDVIANRLGRRYLWPGNVRELEQCVRRVLLKKDYTGDKKILCNDLKTELSEGLEHGTIPVNRLIMGYCKLLYERFGTYEEVAKRTELDRRTVAKYIKERGAEKKAESENMERPEP
ncbi:MAG: sigma 54-interacting transcriptional regulator [Thermodesulfobacteriota bacterium]|nr:sigma 54-interacting transcriptional regulator [Thermodesulfobacteriota bacterium]